MLAGDVHVPEWSFQDEVKLLAIQALQQQRKSGSEGDQSPSDEEVKEEDIFDSSFLNALTVASSTHLSQILSLLAAHIPQAEKSMQNRIKPLRWENVLDIMATSGFVDEKSIENIQSRLEAIYGPSESAAVERARLNTLMKDKLDDMFSGSTSSLLEPPPSPPPRPRKRRKRTGVEVKIESSGD
ncbi:hypothetical protein SERLADRAFT_464117 [Serpula lacrymans var. lacrymans S7.9]|uniref:Uncharacterized protein n=1 Tax=Serpula lacrymans var. lacrymans (strain S7.9) TaxID=578457 RepID=F8NR88_SERL9|nr:uncharacterized protein SERLADRAFT_464117 [Serpula lacrymans var. lacrymans S7.9]EGO26735.1 hypothetical protein SERLADRAFT_464117 [Serpula lacrymans var. lacrymans S7.9]